MNDKEKFQYSALNWLREMNLVNSPQFINQIKFTIYTTSRWIKNSELLILQNHKSMLVLIELGWFSSKFFKNRILEETHAKLLELLPNYSFRVVADKAIFNMALERAKKRGYNA